MIKIKFSLLIVIILFTSQLTLAQHGEGNKEFTKTHDFYNKNKYPKLNYDSLYEAATSVDNSKDGQQLLEACFEAYGGLSELNKIKALQTKWRIKGVLVKDSINMTRTWTKAGNHKTELIHSNGITISRHLFNDSVWHKSSDSVYLMSRNKDILEDFHSLNTALPLSLTKFNNTEIKFGLRADDPLKYLYLKIDGELIVSIGIDPTTHMIVSCEGAIIDEELRLVHIYKYSEHAKLNGFIIPGHYVYVSMGFKTGEANNAGIEVNPTVTDDLFRVK